MEISERIEQSIKKQGVSYKDFCAESGVKYRTLQNYLEGRMPSAEFLITLNTHFGISIDWLLTGKGSMYFNEELLRDYLGVKEDSSIFEGSPNNGDIIELSASKNETASSLNPTSARAQRLTVYINQLLQKSEPDEQAWFEVDFKRNYPNYGEWLEENKN